MTTDTHTCPTCRDTRHLDGYGTCPYCDRPDDALALAALMRQRERLRGRVRAMRRDKCRPRGVERAEAMAEMRTWNAECTFRAAHERGFAMHGSVR